MVSMLRPDGNRIKVLRIRKGWRREQLALNAAVRARTIQRVEAGGNASFDTLRSIAAALEVDARELMMPSVQSSPGRARGVRVSLRERALALCDFVASGFVPYTPAIKGILASFALVLLVAFAIRMSPLLADLEPEIGTIETQLISQTPRSAAIARTVIPAAERQPETASRERGVPAKAAVEPVVTVLSAPPAEIPKAQSPTPAMEHTAVNVQAESSAARNVAHNQPGTIDFAWLASLVEQEPGGESRHAGGHTQTTVRATDGSTQGSGRAAAMEVAANGGSSGGPGVLTKAFIKSGKGTASFFSKVGSSIKRAF